MVKVVLGILVPNQHNHSHTKAPDISMNVLSAMNSWISGTFPNEGFIIKHESSKENDTIDYGQLKFFGKETHTIHQPKVRITWDDSVFQTGSLSSITLTEDIKINCKRLKKSYKVNTTPRIEVHGRELYPTRTFSNEFTHIMMLSIYQPHRIIKLQI